MIECAPASRVSVSAACSTVEMIAALIVRDSASPKRVERTLEDVFDCQCAKTLETVSQPLFPSRLKAELVATKATMDMMLGVEDFVARSRKERASFLVYRSR